MAEKAPCIKLCSGYEIPQVGLGLYFDFQEGVAYPAVSAAIDAGYRMFDTAWFYTTEVDLGRAIKDKIAEGVVTREELFITTKLWVYHMEPEKVEKTCRESLRDLGLDYIDMYLIHWPMAYKTEEEVRGPTWMDKITPQDLDYVDTWRAMQTLVEKGLTRSIGVSNFTIEQIKRILNMEGLKYKPANLQVEVTPNFHNTALVDFCRANDIIVTAYAPLGAPNMSYRANVPLLDTRKILTDLANKYKKNIFQIALRWAIQRGCVVIPGSKNPDHIKQNKQIFDFELTKEDMAQIVDNNVMIQSAAGMKNHPNYPF